MKKTIAAQLFLLMSFLVNAQNDSVGYFTSFDSVKIHYEVEGDGQPV